MIPLFNLGIGDVDTCPDPSEWPPVWKVSKVGEGSPQVSLVCGEDVVIGLLEVGLWIVGAHKALASAPGTVLVGVVTIISAWWVGISSKLLALLGVVLLLLVPYCTVLVLGVETCFLRRGFSILG